MRVSIIVPVRNEAAYIRRTVLGLARQNFPAGDYEILVVDGRSDDGTPEIVRDLQATIPNLRLLDNPKRLASAARNVGVRNAGGKFVVIVDGHCGVADSHFLRNLVDTFEATGADTLGRPQPLGCEQPTPFQQVVAAARMSWLGHNPDSAIFSDSARFVPADNVAVAYRRDVFDLMGEFDESFDACEDVEFNTRLRLAGLTCFFTPAIAVEYQPRGTLRGLFHQMMRYGCGRARLARKHPSTLSVPSLIPPVWLVWLVVGSVGGMFWWPLALTLLTSLAAYLIVVLAESIRVGTASLRRLPFVFAAIHFGFAWGYLRDVTATLLGWPLRFHRAKISWRLINRRHSETSARPR